MKITLHRCIFAYNDYLCKRLDCMNNELQPSYDCIERVTVENIDKCIRGLKKGKACGPDDLCAEHLHYAHPALIMHLKTLFKHIIYHGFVPKSFGFGIAVPLVKDKAGNINNL